MSKIGKIYRCDICGKEGPGSKVCFYSKAGKTLCKKHGHQYNNFGKFLDSNPRTIKDKNEILVYEEYAEIILYNTKCEVVGKTIIDLDDIEKVKDIKWCLTPNNYCVCDKKKYGFRFLHRFIIGISNEENIYGDHINHNTLDNRKINLRNCDLHGNAQNISLPKNNTSGIIGVSYSKKRNKYESKIGKDWKTINLGRYFKFEDAVKARLEAEAFYFGEFAPQKHLFEEYGINSSSYSRNNSVL